MTRRHAALTAEDRLLLACTRSALDDGARQEMAESLAAPLDWPAVLARSRQEGTAALLHHHLRSLPRAAAQVPPAIRMELRRAHRGTWARNTVLTEHWAEVMRLLERARIPCITHKGMALVHTVYGDLGLRPMADLDLLIRPADLPAVRRALAGAGFRCSGEAVETEDAFRGFLHCVRGACVIDLHWELAHYTRFEGVVRLDAGGLWRRAQPLVVGTAGGLMLCPEDLLLHLALHLTLGSEFGRLVWFTDIDAVLRRRAADLDWDRLLGEATRARLRGVLAYTLAVAQAALGSPVPAEVLRSLRLGTLRRLALGGVIETQRPPTLTGPMEDVRAYLAETLLMDRLRDVARVATTSLFPSRSWLRFRYGAASRRRMLACRVLHPIRVCALVATRLLARSALGQRDGCAGKTMAGDPGHLARTPRPLPEQTNQ
ncbi:MAG: nucleotidyltransferase family protein [Candidatus Methylomirabilales bacterium]